MFEFNPFISNDGSVGLYSKQNEDIYHSVYGALTESWEKFVLNVEWEKLFSEKKEIRVLDICYGIGYNTKTLIQNILNNKKNFCLYSTNTDSIYTDNILRDEFTSNYTESIDADNTSAYFGNSRCSESIDSDNNFKENPSKDNKKFVCEKIFIDSVELNKKLMMLSPFIENKLNYKNILEINLPEVVKIKNKNILPSILEEEFKISDEVNFYLFNKSLKIFKKSFIKSMLSKKEYRKFFSNDMRRLFQIYDYGLIEKNPKRLLRRFLHNIYYRYVSKRYNNALKSPIFKLFDINLISDDIISVLRASAHVYDVVFLDAFTPAKCPKLWTLEFFKLLYEHMDDNAILLTYSNSAQVRNAMINAGFHVGKIFSESSNKFTGTTASKNPAQIKHNLSEYDIGLLNTKSGIFYRDENFTLTNGEILSNHKAEVEASNLISASKYIKKNIGI